MTRDKSPLEELIEALVERPTYLAVPGDISRVDLIKVIWQGQAPFAPPGACDVDDGTPVLIYPDPDDDGEFITYMRLRYGEHVVVEAEGVVVCRLT